MASYDDRGINTISLAKNLSAINDLTDNNNQAITGNTEITLPKIINLNNIKYILEEDGNVEKIIEGKLPSIYQKVEYIESTGTQYIDTGFIPNQDTRFIIDWSLNYIGNSISLVGSRQYNIDTKNDENSYYFGKWSSYNNYNFAYYYGNNYDVVYRNDLFGVRHIIDANKNKLYVDNNIIFNIDYCQFNSRYPIYLFAFSSDYNITSPPKAQFFCKNNLYASQIYDDEKIVRNFIPCYRVNDAVIGLYDTVEGKFYTNQGSGTFGYGMEDGTYVAPQ